MPMTYETRMVCIVIVRRVVVCIGVSCCYDLWIVMRTVLGCLIFYYNVPLPAIVVVVGVVVLLVRESSLYIEHTLRK
jgi:hypothetical protein